MNSGSVPTSSDGAARAGSSGDGTVPFISARQLGGWWSRLTFSWVRPLLDRGYAKPHTLESLLPLLVEERCDVAHENFAREFERARSHRRPLLVAFWRMHRRTLSAATLCMLFHVLFQTASAVLLRSLVNALQRLAGRTGISDPLLDRLMPDPTASAITVAVLMLVSSILMTVGVHHAFYRYLRVAARLKSQLTAAIYLKSLKLARDVKHDTPSGQIVNLMANDVNRLHWLMPTLHSPFVHPVQIVLILLFLYQTVGWAALVGASITAGLLGISALFAKANVKVKKDFLVVADKRVGIINEVLTHMRVIKLYGWERSFFDSVSELRNREVTYLKRIALIAVGMATLFQGAPVIVTSATFVTLAINGTVPPVADLLSTIALFSLLRWGMSLLPESVVAILEGNVSARRIEAFLALREHEPVRSEPSLPQGAVRLTGYSSEWSAGVAALSNVDLKVEPGELVCVVGTIGSGKSALLLSILGELGTASGSSVLNGTVAYVAQHPWIANDTLERNITLARDENPELLDACVSASGLLPDLARFSGGMSTEIGERGINLSGGQKQRLSLARAAYSSADIYLLDDPLSALDRTVGKHVYDRLITGLLAGKTRILVTHRLEYASRADRVVVLDRGAIVESGSPEDLLGRESLFRSLLDGYSRDPSVGSESSGAGETDSEAAVVTADMTESLAAETDLVDELPDAAAGIVEAEERRFGRVGRSTYARYLRIFAPGIILPAVAVLYLSREVLGVGTDGWLSRWASSGGEVSISRFLCVYGLLACGVLSVTFFRVLLVRLRGLKAGTDFHRGLLQGVLRAPIQFFDSNPVGRILSRFSGDIETADITIPWTIAEALSALSAVIGAMTLVMAANPVLIFGALPLAYFYYRFQRVFRPTSRECQRLESIHRSPIFSQYSESLSGLETIRAYGWEEPFRRRLFRNVDLYQQSFCNLVAANRWLGPRIEFLGAMVIFASAITPILVPSTFGPAIAGVAAMYSIAVTGALNWFIRMITQLETNMNSVERIDFYTRTPGEKWEGVEPPAEWPSTGAISMRDLTVQYRPNLPPALTGISMNVLDGERIGIAGRTGAGKSTLVLALTRLIEPAGGEIVIDGLSATEVSLEALRRSIAVIPQDPVMFLGSLRRNLDAFGQFSDDDIWEALRRTHVEEFVRSLPDGLEAEVREGGVNFSAGQRQLICLARALLRRNRIIVLDEATANVDTETDSLVQRTVRDEFRGRTILIIAHRLNTILDCDRIMILEGGRIAEFDSVPRLLARPGGALRELLAAEGGDEQSSARYSAI